MFASGHSRLRRVTGRQAPCALLRKRKFPEQYRLRFWLFPLSRRLSCLGLNHTEPLLRCPSSCTDAQPNALECPRRGLPDEFGLRLPATVNTIAEVDERVLAGEYGRRPGHALFAREPGSITTTACVTRNGPTARRNNRHRWLWLPAFAGTTRETFRLTSAG